MIDYTSIHNQIPTNYNPNIPFPHSITQKSSSQTILNISTRSTTSIVSCISLLFLIILTITISHNINASMIYHSTHFHSNPTVETGCLDFTIEWDDSINPGAQKPRYYRIIPDEWDSRHQASYRRGHLITAKPTPRFIAINFDDINHDPGNSGKNILPEGWDQGPLYVRIGTNLPAIEFSKIFLRGQITINFCYDWDDCLASPQGWTPAAMTLSLPFEGSGVVDEDDQDRDNNNISTTFELLSSSTSTINHIKKQTKTLSDAYHNAHAIQSDHDDFDITLSSHHHVDQKPSYRIVTEFHEDTSIYPINIDQVDQELNQELKKLTIFEQNQKNDQKQINQKITPMLSSTSQYTPPVIPQGPTTQQLRIPIEHNAKDSIASFQRLNQWTLPQCDAIPVSTYTTRSMFELLLKESFVNAVVTNAKSKIDFFDIQLIGIHYFDFFIPEKHRDDPVNYIKTTHFCYLNQVPVLVQANSPQTRSLRILLTNSLTKQQPQPKTQTDPSLDLIIPNNSNTNTNSYTPNEDPYSFIQQIIPQTTNRVQLSCNQNIALRNDFYGYGLAEDIPLFIQLQLGWMSYSTTGIPQFHQYVDRFSQFSDPSKLNPFKIPPPRVRNVVTEYNGLRQVISTSFLMEFSGTTGGLSGPIVWDTRKYLFYHTNFKISLMLDHLIFDQSNFNPKGRSTQIRSEYGYVVLYFLPDVGFMSEEDWGPMVVLTRIYQDPITAFPTASFDLYTPYIQPHSSDEEDDYVGFNVAGDDVDQNDGEFNHQPKRDGGSKMNHAPKNSKMNDAQKSSKINDDAQKSSKTTNSQKQFFNMFKSSKFQQDQKDKFNSTQEWEFHQQEYYNVYEEYKMGQKDKHNSSRGQNNHPNNHQNQNNYQNNHQNNHQNQNNHSNDQTTVDNHTSHSTPFHPNSQFYPTDYIPSSDLPTTPYQRDIPFSPYQSWQKYSSSELPWETVPIQVVIKWYLPETRFLRRFPQWAAHFELEHTDPQTLQVDSTMFELITFFNASSFNLTNGPNIPLLHSPALNNIESSSTDVLKEINDKVNQVDDSDSKGVETRFSNETSSLFNSSTTPIPQHLEESHEEKTPPSLKDRLVVHGMIRNQKNPGFILNIHTTNNLQGYKNYALHHGIIDGDEYKFPWESLNSSSMQGREIYKVKDANYTMFGPTGQTIQSQCLIQYLNINSPIFTYVMNATISNSVNGIEFSEWFLPNHLETVLRSPKFNSISIVCPDVYFVEFVSRYTPQKSKNGGSFELNNVAFDDVYVDNDDSQQDVDVIMTDIVSPPPSLIPHFTPLQYHNAMELFNEHSSTYSHPLDHYWITNWVNEMIIHPIVETITPLNSDHINSETQDEQLPSLQSIMQTTKSSKECVLRPNTPSCITFSSCFLYETYDPDVKDPKELFTPIRCDVVWDRVHQTTKHIRLHAMIPHPLSLLNPHTIIVATWINTVEPFSLPGWAIALLSLIGFVSVVALTLFITKKCENNKDRVRREKVKVMCDNDDQVKTDREDLLEQIHELYQQYNGDNDSKANQIYQHQDDHAIDGLSVTNRNQKKNNNNDNYESNNNHEGQITQTLLPVESSSSTQ